MREDSYLGDVLKKHLHDIGREDVIDLGEIHGKWRGIAGEKLSRWSEPASLNGGRLVILVPAPVWASEVHMASDGIKRRIEEETGIVVDEIRVRIRPEAAQAAPGPDKPKDKHKG